MLNSNIKEKIIPMPIVGTYRILCINKERKPYVQTVMTYIDKEEENELDNIEDKIITIIRGDKTFQVKSNQILCYGEVDFSDNSDDLDVIENFKFLNYLGWSGIHIRTGYDYETHTCSCFNNRILWTETWSPSVVAQLAHGWLGKPKRIILFNHKL